MWKRLLIVGSIVTLGLSFSCGARAQVTPIPDDKPAQEKAAPEAAAPEATGDSKSAIEAIEAEILRLINEQRAADGLAVLEPNAKAGELSREHSEAMASGQRPFGHEGHQDRMKRLDLYVVENAFATPIHKDVPQQVLKTWKKSEAHNGHMMGDYTSAGVGAALGDDGKYYVTALFARPMAKLKPGQTR
ncbi:MAG: CAP domain-containing protein [Planctomycetota bacterium]|jgi:uncharacterized protein YkwD